MRSVPPRPLAAIAVAVLGALLAPAPARAQPAEQKHVLILWGGRVDLPVNDVVNRGIRTTLYEEFGSGVDFRFEFVEEASISARSDRAA